MITEVLSRPSGARAPPRNSQKIPPENVGEAASSNSSSSTLNISSNNKPRIKDHGRKRGTHSCCPSARNLWLLKPLLHRAQEVFTAVESELQQTLHEQHHHIAATAVRDLQAFADLLSSLVCSQEGPQELLQGGSSEGPLQPRSAATAPASGVDASFLAKLAATTETATTAAPPATACGSWASPTVVCPGAQLRRPDGSPIQQHEQQHLQLHEHDQKQQEPKQQPHVDHLGNARGEKRRRAPSKQTQETADQPTAGVALAVLTPPTAEPQQSRRRRDSPRDDGTVPAAAAAGAAAVEPPATAAAPAAGRMQRPTGATPHSTPPPSQAAAAPPPPPPPPPFAAVPPPPPPPPVACWAATGPPATTATAAVDSRQMNTVSVAVPGLSSEALAALSSLSEREREETVEILNALSLPPLLTPTQQRHADGPAGPHKGSDGLIAPADGDKGIGERATLNSRQQKRQQQETQSAVFNGSSKGGTTPAAGAPLASESAGASTGGLPGVISCVSRSTEACKIGGSSDAEEGEISDYGLDRPSVPPAALQNAAGDGTGDGVREEQHQEQQQARISRLPIAGEATYRRESGGCSNPADTGDCGGSFSAETVPSSPRTASQGVGTPDSSLLDALIAARPLSSEAVLCNLYSLKKCEASRPQQQLHRKQKRRTQEAQERHRQRWAQIQQRRAQAAARRQQVKGNEFGREEDGSSHCTGEKAARLPLTPLTHC